MASSFLEQALALLTWKKPLPNLTRRDGEMLHQEHLDPLSEGSFFPMEEHTPNKAFFPPLKGSILPLGVFRVEDRGRASGMSRHSSAWSSSL